jgi:hypothetical protein
MDTGIAEPGTDLAVFVSKNSFEERVLRKEF